MNSLGVNTIILIRLNLLPPYSYDEDEDEKDIDDYLKYYNFKISKCLNATDEYIDAFLKFSSNIDSDDAFNQLIIARSKFIKYFPFSYDELPFENEEFYKSALEFMKNIYKEDAKKNYLIKKLKEYQEALESLQCK